MLRYKFDREVITYFYLREISEPIKILLKQKMCRSMLNLKILWRYISRALIAALRKWNGAWMEVLEK